VHYYEAIGIDSIKLVNRAMTTQAILLVVDAYTKGYYEGNLLDLFSRPSKNLIFQRPNVLHKIRYFFHPFHINIFAFLKAKRLLGEMKVYIDNRSLDGFIDYFLNENCHLKSCEDCKHCHRVAERIIRFAPDWKSEAVSNYREYLDSLVTGKMFKYTAHL
jgi:hypothetical protein